MTVINDKGMGTTPDNFPIEVNIEILTSQMGKSNNYQKYVVGMRVQYTQRSIVNDKSPVQILNIVNKEVLPTDIEAQRARLRRQPFYDLFYPLMQKDSYAETRKPLIVVGLVVFILLILF